MINQSITVYAKETDFYWLLAPLLTYNNNKHSTHRQYPIRITIILFHFLGLGSGSNGNPDLGLGGDIVRYLFSIFPVFNFSYSLIGLGQTQAENNICLNYIDKDTLTLVCTELRDFIANPKPPIPAASTYVYAQCCDAPYVEDPR